MQHFDFCMDLLFVLPIPFAVINGINHQQQTDHQTRYNSGKEQVTDRSAEAIPYMMNGILGGMITPRPPATATIAVENVRS